MTAKSDFFCEACWHPRHWQECQAAAANKPFCGCHYGVDMKHQEHIQEQVKVEGEQLDAYVHPEALTGVSTVAKGQVSAAQELSRYVDDYRRKKHDSGKVRMDLLPFDVLYEIAKVFTFGCTPKEEGGAGYEEGSWMTVPDGIKRYTAAELRHHADRAKGEIYDPASKLRHRAHEAWNACALLWFELHGKGDE